MTKNYSIRIFIASCFHWLLFIAFLNTVIDAPNNIPNAGFNEMESIYEWVAEDLMDIENAVPEQEDADHDQRIQKKSVDWIVVFSPFLLQEQPITASYIFSFANSFYFNPVFDIHTPPPEYLA